MLFRSHAGDHVVAGMKELKTLKGATDMITGVVFTPDNASVLSIGFDRLLRVWSVAGGNETKKLGPTADDLYGIAYSRDGKNVATSGYGGSLTIWDLAAGKATWSRKIKFGAYCVTFTPDGKELVTGHEPVKDGRTVIITPLAAK